MAGNKIWRNTRITLLAVTVSLVFASMAWGQSYGRYDDDDSYHRRDQAGDQGYRSGYRDGLRVGQTDSERGRRFKFKNDDWEDSRGFQHWMGDKGEYKRAYRDGYEQGYRRSYASYGDRRYDNRRYDDHRDHDRYRDDWR